MPVERGQDTSIDTRNGNMSNNATPTEHTASPASPTHSIESARGSTKSAFQSHGKSWSMASESTFPVRANRFSVQFPIQLSGSNTPARTTSPVREPAAHVPTDTLAALQNGAPDSNSFLNLIAGQERRVLELKEELQRAEADLDKLKRQWARHEVQKKKEDVKRMTKLQPLQTSVPAADKEDDVDGSSAWMQQEMERRKVLLSRSNTNGSRTILPGQRHTRALSLLSPARDNIRDTAAPAPMRPLPPRKQSLKNRESSEAGVSGRPALITRQSESSDLTNKVDRTAGTHVDLTQRASIDQEMLLRTGKKMATDFKDGLWTFWEDLRQATVGEESHQIPPAGRQSSTQTLRTARKQSSRNSLRPSSRGSSTVSKSSEQTKQPSPARKQSTSAALPDLADPSFWSEFGVTPPTSQTTQATTKRATASKHAKSPSMKRLSAVSSDPWDTWDDSPEPSRSSSSETSETNTLPSTVSGSPRTSASINTDSKEAEKRDPIPWPVIKKSGFGSLRRTASNLMNEWEASLMPASSLGSEHRNQNDYLGASAEAAAYGAGTM